MPKGVYIKTQEHRDNISKNLMGRKLSEEHKQNIKKNQPTYFGDTNLFYGKTHSEKNKKIWSESKKGDKNPFYGKKHTSETIERLRQIRLNNPTYNKHPKDCRCPYCNGLSLERNPNWRGGKSFEPYPLGWNKTFKEQIRFRDGYRCQMCGKPEVENMGKLAVHHIDYFKQNISSFNLVSLCRRCHTKTNFTREHWKKFFQPFQLGLALYE